jgi:hypothetical protein
VKKRSIRTNHKFGNFSITLVLFIINRIYLLGNIDANFIKRINEREKEKDKKVEFNMKKQKDKAKEKQKEDFENTNDETKSSEFKDENEVQNNLIKTLDVD